MKKAILSVFLAAAIGATLCACTTPEEPDKDKDKDKDKDPPAEVVDLTDFKLTKEYFEGKNVVVYGDSITTPASKSGHHITVNYIDLLKNELNFNLLNNFAINGTTATHSVSKIPLNAAKEDLESGPRYVDENTFYNEQADYAIIMYGANDQGLGAAIGENTDDPQDYRETVTYKGGINYMVKKLRLANPVMRILFLTPLWHVGPSDPPVNAATGLAPYDYGDALFDLKDKLQAKVIDCYPVFNKDNFGPGLNSDDGTHPSDEGHRILCDYLLGK